MGLVRVRGGQAKEEVDDLEGVRPVVAIVSEERNFEVQQIDEGLEVGPKDLDLVDVVVDVAYAAHHFQAWWRGVGLYM